MTDVMSKPQVGNSVSNAAPAVAGDGASSDSPTLLAKLRYRFDAALSRGPSVVIAYLGIITAAVILLAALIITIFSITGINGEVDKKHGILENFWLSMTRFSTRGRSPARTAGRSASSCCSSPCRASSSSAASSV